MNYLKLEFYQRIKIDFQLFEFIQDFALDGFWYLDVEQPKNIWLNPKLSSILNFNELISNWENFINPIELKSVIENIQKKTFDTKNPLEQIFNYTDKNKITANCFIIPIYDDNKKIIRLLGANKLISNELNNSEAIQRAEEKYLLIAENTSDGIVVTDSKGKINYCSPSYLKQLGFSEKEELERNHDGIFLLIHPDERDELFAKIFKAIEEKKSELNYEFRIKHKNGHYIHRRDQAKFHYDESGSWIHTYIICKDITEEKIQKQKLDDSKNEAELLAKFYKDLVENQSVYIVKTDMQGNYTYLNQYFIKRFANEHSVGKSSMESIIKEDWQKCIDVVNRCIANPGVGNMVILRKHFNGGVINNFWEFKAILNLKGEISEILCIGFDITEMFEIQDQLKNTLSLIENQNKRLQNFAYIVSHNLRSHTSNISSLISFLSEPELRLEENTYFSYLKKATENLFEAIEHLSEVAQIHTTKEIQLEAINLKQAIDKACSNIISLAIEGNLWILNELQEDEIIFGDKVYINSILLNFLTNAIKYKSEKNDSFVKFTSFRKNEFIVLVIEDNGLGIDLKRNGHKLFGMYKTFHKHPEAKGIGLFMVKNQLDAMGAKIEVESEVGVGTIFKVYFKHEKA